MRFKDPIFALLAVTIGMSASAQAEEPPAPKLTLISNVNVFDGKTDKLHEKMHVLVKGNLIETVSKEPLADAERVLRDFARRAFRRPPA